MAIKRDQPIHQIANPITAATIPKKLTAHNAVLQDCFRIRSVLSCRVAAITSETAASTGRTQRRYSTEIDMTLLPQYCGEPEWLPLSQPSFYQHIEPGQYCYDAPAASVNIADVSGNWATPRDRWTVLNHHRQRLIILGSAQSGWPTHRQAG